VVTVRLAFDSVADRDELLKHFAEAAETVTTDEPGVTSYRASIDITDPTKMIFIEGCADWLLIRLGAVQGKRNHAFKLAAKLKRETLARAPGAWCMHSSCWYLPKCRRRMWYHQPTQGEGVRVPDPESQAARAAGCSGFRTRTRGWRSVTAAPTRR